MSLNTLPSSSSSSFPPCLQELRPKQAGSPEVTSEDQVQSVQVPSELSCDQTKFLNPNGTCVECPACGPGEQLSEECGFGDDDGESCVPCDKGKFSSDTDAAPCRRCTRCSLLSCLVNTACSPSSDALCGKCLPGCYELRSVTGEVEPSCVPCHSHDTVHKECLLSIAQGSKAEQIPDLCPGPEGLQKLSETPSQEEFLSRGLNSLNHGNETHPTSIVINVTTNIKPSGQQTENITQEEPKSSCFSSDEVGGRPLYPSATAARKPGDGVEALDYDSVQDLSLLLDSEDDKTALRGLGRSGRPSSPRLPGPLPVPAHLHLHAAAPAGPGRSTPA
ncbi:unnamed protein product [Pleuronectes platessa]|uniref:TNFR-Cys domain-containing protein n=1 Tax=Pleuronectes platessa TaxID=8262 RepID=A0A9N7ZCS8_PLEPL|nr:unnamed protein product [Pleuronectes platessa]